MSEKQRITWDQESRPVSLNKIQVTDAFWKNEMELVRREVIPYQWDALNDRIPEAAPSYCMHNFKTAGMLNRLRREKQSILKQGEVYQQKTWPLTTFETLPEDRAHLEDRFYGFLFQDSDFSKWIEAVGYSLTQHPDPQLEAIADEAIEIVAAAQLENGYLDTYYIINDQSKIFSNLKDNHELYCFGHLTEGAVAYYQATGKDKLLKAAQRYADYVASYFGPDEETAEADGSKLIHEKCKGYPGHEIAEMALVRLYEQTQDPKYLELSRFFVDQRGTRLYYFDKEHPEEAAKAKEELRYQYHQAHLPVREQDEAVGHAVRAVYLYSGMADIARITKDEDLYQACDRLWDNIVNQKMYITGGIGATHMGEAFSFDYDLPNDTAYAETCASIGLVFFARRMLQMKADSKYANIMEKALYNGILSGMALDGKSFFYVNPLETLPEACHKDERKFHVKPIRQKWFGCACCPPNIARLLSSIASYACTESEDTLYYHLYMGSVQDKEVNGRKVDIRMESAFPWDGKVKVEIRCEEETDLTLAFRIPDWCSAYRLNGEDGPGEGMRGTYARGSWKVENGYLYLSGGWKDADTVELDFPMEVRLMQADPRVREDMGKVAVTRGPVVYCMEEADNGRNLHLCSLAEDISPEVTESAELGAPMRFLTLKGRRIKERKRSGLYEEYRRPEEEDAVLRWIPYYAWANRGEGEMTVWIRTR